MKLLSRLLAFSLLATSWSGVAEGFPSETIVNNGPPREKVDLVFLGEGYTSSELTQYRDDVQRFTDYLFTQPPFSDYKSFFNVHRVDVVSSQSGIDDPCRGLFVDTAFDGMVCGDRCDFFGLPVELFGGLRPETVRKISEAAQSAAGADTVVIIINTALGARATAYLGYGVALTPRGPDLRALDTMVHELGHSFGFFYDEYVSLPGTQWPRYFEPAAPNVTANTDRATLKWGEWVRPEIPLPTLTTTPDTPGLYEGASHYQFGIYRPTCNSKMRDASAPFERVNYSLLVDRIFDYIPPDTTPLVLAENRTPHETITGQMTIDVTLTDPESYVMAYRLSNRSDFQDTVWGLASNAPTFHLERPWRLTPGGGLKTIYLQAKNGYGLIAPIELPVNLDVSADAIPPTTPGTPTVHGRAYLPTISWDASTDEESGLAYYELQRSDNELAFTAIAAVADTGFRDGYLAAGTYRYRVRAVDYAGNESPFAELPDPLVVTENQAPVIQPINPQVLDRISFLAFDVIAADPDGDAFLLTAALAGEGGLPHGADFYGLTGQKNFHWSPAPTVERRDPYLFTFTATETERQPPLHTSITVPITIIHVNRRPLIGTIDPITVPEGTRLSFTVPAADPDGDRLTYLARYYYYQGGVRFLALGLGGALLNSATGLFDWTPGFGQSGVYELGLQVRDIEPMMSNSRQVTITVEDVNQAPVIAPLPDVTGRRNQALSMTAIASDFDGDALTLSADGLPLLGLGADFVDQGRSAADGKHRGLFTWMPQRSGSCTVTFTASDGKLSTSTTVRIAVVNQAPIFTGSLVDRTVTAGQALNLTLSATDPDGDPLTYSAVDLQTGMSLDGNTGAFSWTPTASQTGSYNVTFLVSDGELSDSGTVTLTVFRSQLNPTQFPWQSGAFGSLSLSASPGLDVLDVAGYDFTALVDGQITHLGGYFSGTKTVELFNQRTGERLAGATVPSTAFGWHYAAITPPVAVQAGIPYTVAVYLNGSGGSHRRLSSPVLPRVMGSIITINASFGDDSVAFPTTCVQACTRYPGAMSGQADIGFAPVTTVTPPILSPIGPKQAEEGEAVTITLAASGIAPMTYSTEGLPEGATLTGQTFSWTPGYLVASPSGPGIFDVTFTVTDSQSLRATETVRVTVLNVNRVPSLTVPTELLAVQEQGTLTFAVVGSDPDDPAGATLRYSASGLPVELGGRMNIVTGQFMWTPTYDHGRLEPYTVTITVRDQDPEQELQVSRDVTITVENVNQPPQLKPLPVLYLREVEEGEASTIDLAPFAFDPDHDQLTFLVTGLESWASVDAQTGVLTLAQGFDVVTAGELTRTWQASLSVDDGRLGRATKSLWITVEHVNRCPPDFTLTPAGPHVVREGQRLVVTAKGNADPDGDDLTFSATGLPDGALFIRLGDVTLDGYVGGADAAQISAYVNGRLSFSAIQEAVADVDENGLIEQVDADRISQYNARLIPYWNTHRFVWIPAYDQAGSYLIAINDSDGKLLGTEQVIMVTVENANQAPALGMLPDQTVAEETSTTVDLAPFATDPDGDALASYSVTGLPAWASLNAQTGELTLKPGFDVVSPAEGQKTFTAQVTVSDGQASSAPQLLTISVQHVNQAPSATLIPAGMVTGKEGQVVVVKMQGSDPDGEGLSFSASALPTGAQFVPLGDVNLSGQVTGTDATYISYYLAGKISLDARQQAVADVNQQDGITILDANLVSNYLAGNLTGLPPFWNTRAFLWTPGIGQVGDFPMTFTVTDGLASASETVTITVQPNPPPVITTPPHPWSQTVAEGQLLAFDLVASDPEGEPLTWTVAPNPLPAGAQFDRTLAPPRFSWMPDYTQAASYAVKFTVSDGLREVVQLTTITVRNVNRPPTLTLQPVGPTTAPEGTTFLLDAIATDPDGGSPTLSASLSGGSPLPTGAVFTDHGNATGRLTWTPSFTQAGTYTIAVTVRDDDPQAPLSAAQSVTLTVQDVQTPWQVMAPLCGGTVYTNSGWHYAMGYRFTPKKSGQITHLGGFFNGTKVVKLFDKSTTPPTLLAQTTVAGNNTWVYAPLGSPVAISSTKTYIVAVYLAGSGASYRSALASRLPKDALDAASSPYLTIHGSVYAYTGSDPNAIPTYEVTATMYGQADVGFAQGP